MVEPVVFSAGAIAGAASSSNSRAEAGMGIRGAAAVFAAFVLESALLALSAIERIPLPVLILSHLGVVGLLVLILRQHIRSGADGGLALLAVIGILATGPFGALGTLAMPLFARRKPATDALLASWYERIALSSNQDDFTKLSDRVAIGRSANLAAPMPPSFVDLFHSGPIADQQVALGVIARSFHPGYLPVLKVALDSPEPLVRVQAAAVAARIRGQLNTHVVTLFIAAADPTLSLAAAQEVVAQLRSALASGLLEASVQKSAAGILDGLTARIFSKLDARRRRVVVVGRSTPELTDDAVFEEYSAFLLAAGRFDDFRATRLAVRRHVRGRYRSRLVIARPAGTAFKQQLRASAVRR